MADGDSSLNLNGIELKRVVDEASPLPDETIQGMEACFGDCQCYVTEHKRSSNSSHDMVVGGDDCVYDYGGGGMT